MRPGSSLRERRLYEAGDIVAVLGLDPASGDTYCSQYPYCTLESMFVPEPVIKMAVAPVKREGADKFSKALQRFRRERNSVPAALLQWPHARTLKWRLRATRLRLRSLRDARATDMRP